MLPLTRSTTTTSRCDAAGARSGARSTTHARARAGALAMAIVALGASALGDITLRDGKRISDPVVIVGVEGITVGTERPRLIGWEQIASVDGPASDSAAHYMPMAELVWRAIIRLNRGDLLLARPALEELFAQLEHERGSAALLAAEGLLRCRLAAAELPGALRPWLQAVRHREAKTTPQPPPTPSPTPASLLDAATLLCPALPPFFTPQQAGQALGELGLPAPTLAKGLPAELAEWYRCAALHDSGVRPVTTPGKPGEALTGHPGAQLIGDLVMARAATTEADRRFYRQRLRQGLDADLNTWREAWRRAGLGLSLLMENDPASVRQGVLELLHLPARFSSTQPQLAGLALAHAAGGLDRLGLHEQAQLLRDELRAQYPMHPALTMLSDHDPPTLPTPSATDPPTSRGP
jgi:hypothetical protein